MKKTEQKTMGSEGRRDVVEEYRQFVSGWMDAPQGRWVVRRGERHSGRAHHQKAERQLKRQRDGSRDTTGRSRKVPFCLPSFLYRTSYPASPSAVLERAGGTKSE